ncbi:MAG TPA: DUF2723 domain-containing protein [Elusimicrobiota bacterium]|nr:DUF2723 domain-containing protein [Elusimicrobiota bacterium]
MNGADRLPGQDDFGARTRRVLPFVLFLAFWGFHLHFAGGTVVPYRDSGEMVTDAHTLGVAHPPGYPLYVLLGKVFVQSGWGNPAYRVNLLSSLSSAAAETGLFLLMWGVTGSAAVAGAAALWATSAIFWELSSVSEMYTLGLLGMVLLFVFVRRISDEHVPRPSRWWPAAAFLFGVGCGVRTDFLLLSPALAYLCWRRGGWRILFPALGAAFLGLTVFLYLPLRSARQPWVDWNNPEGLDRFLGSLMRKSHGGTLDLLSKSYALGENFVSEFILYLKTLASDFTWVGLPLAVLGGGHLRKRLPVFSTFLLINLAVFGPLFLFLANMPPNPHAVAIVEAHYAVSHLIVALLMAAGLAAVFRWRGGGKRTTLLLTAAVSALVAVNAAAHRGRGDKRWNLYARDYVGNMLRSSLPGSFGVLREDVPLFAFWERQLVSHQRPDVTIVAQGLAASPWYQETMKQAGRFVPLGRLDDERGWESYVNALAGKPLWVGGDANLSWKNETKPAGLVIYLTWPAEVGPVLFDPLRMFEFYVIRGERRQTRAPDFFSSDLLTEYARAALRASSALMREKRWDEAALSLRRGMVFDSEFPALPFNWGYVLYQQGRLEESGAADARASRIFEELFRRAAYYKSLPAVVEGLRREAAEVWIHRGVLAEKRGDLEAARNSYAQAVRLDPKSSQAHYNWAVTYWNREWDQAVAHMQAAVAADPGNAQAAYFLDKARALREQALKK